jgi:hypothetical protein
MMMPSKQGSFIQSIFLVDPKTRGIVVCVVS